MIIGFAILTYCGGVGIVSYVVSLLFAAVEIDLSMTSTKSSTSSMTSSLHNLLFLGHNAQCQYFSAGHSALHIHIEFSLSSVHKHYSYCHHVLHIYKMCKTNFLESEHIFVTRGNLVVYDHLFSRSCTRDLVPEVRG